MKKQTNEITEVGTSIVSFKRYKTNDQRHDDNDDD